MKLGKLEIDEFILYYLILIILIIGLAFISNRLDIEKEKTKQLELQLQLQQNNNIYEVNNNDEK